MGFWNKWPYSNFHEINLDWILSKIKEIYGKVNDFAREWVKKLAEEAQARKEADDALNARVDQEIQDRTEADEAEAAARQEADEQLQDNINKEQQRAEAAEKVLDDKITAETERATAKENDLQQQITAEVNRATAAENNLQQQITSNDTDIAALQKGLQDETTARTEADETLDQKITAETSRATAREDELEDMITAETERATAKETELDQKITTETQRATAAEDALGDRIDGLEGELDGVTGAESPFIRKDGSTTTTGKIPLAMGGTSEVDPAAATDLVNLRSMQAADEALQQTMTEYVDNQLETAMGDVHSIPAGGTAGQVLSKVDATDYNTQWIDPPSGSDPDAIKKDGTTTTTAMIPFVDGISFGSFGSSAWFESGAIYTDAGELDIAARRNNVDRASIKLDRGLAKIETNSLQLRLSINNSTGTAGQVLTAQGDGTCAWGDVVGRSQYENIMSLQIAQMFRVLIYTGDTTEFDQGSHHLGSVALGGSTDAWYSAIKDGVYIQLSNSTGVVTLYNSEPFTLGKNQVLGVFHTGW